MGNHLMAHAGALGEPESPPASLREGDVVCVALGLCCVPSAPWMVCGKSGGADEDALG